MTTRVSVNAANVPAIVAALSGLTIISWLAMLALDSGNAGQRDLLIWSAMTIGMMTPSAVPMVVAYARLAPQLDPELSTGLSVSIFMAAYLVLWLTFAALATALQSEMQRHFLIDNCMAFTRPWLGALFLISAGLYQLTPLKHICIAKCRTPLGFLAGAYRSGYRGAFRTGLQHGIFCIGCCWLLMALVWVGGMMSLAWMAMLSLLIIFEKTVPRAEWLITGVGALLIVLGLATLVIPRSNALLTWDEIVRLYHRAA
jgi:predicted metal-binding membrane protein